MAGHAAGSSFPYLSRRNRRITWLITGKNGLFFLEKGGTTDAADRLDTDRGGGGAAGDSAYYLQLGARREDLAARARRARLASLYRGAGLGAPPDARRCGPARST